MNILLLGSGGREHALAWKLRESLKCDYLFIAPGNAGTHFLGTNLPFAVDDIKSIIKACKFHNIQMVVIGPEAALAAGVREAILAEEDLKKVIVIGPGKLGATLESSKDFSKKFMEKYSIPTAQAITFESGQADLAKKYINTEAKAPFVIKADGLAAGKGVIITSDKEEAFTAIDDMLVSNKFGKSGEKILIEQFLDGIELSVFVLTNGKQYTILGAAKDYKRIGEGDTGPNTGGMGAVTPVSFYQGEFEKKIESQIIIPTIQGLQKENIPFQGFLFLGLIKVGNEPYLIEYNTRMGDPETQVIMPSLDCDLVELFQDCDNQSLDFTKVKNKNEKFVSIVIASQGYPSTFEKGKKVDLPPFLKHNELLFHSGTKLNEENEVCTDGGRVFSSTCSGENLETAIENSLSLAEKVKFDGKYYRKDIGQDLVKLIN